MNPDITLAVSDKVRHFKKKQEANLEVQIKISQNIDEIIGINDIIYVVPEFSPKDYLQRYPAQKGCYSDPKFAQFFNRYSHFQYKSHVNQIPEKLKLIDKNLCCPIDCQDDAVGKSFINLNCIPNGNYTVFYLRIGQPVNYNSRLKILGGKSILVNINRDKLR